MHNRGWGNNRSGITKKLAVSELAEVRISPELVVSYELGRKRDHVHTVIGLPRGIWDRSMPNLLVCDHRSNTLNSRRGLFFACSDHHNKVAKQREISEIMGRPARVSVIERKIDGKSLPFVNLYDLTKEEEHQTLSCLFSVYFYRVGRRGSDGITCGAPLWSLSARKFERSNRQYTAIYSLTNEKRRLVLDTHDSGVLIIGGPTKTEREGVASSSHDDMVSIERHTP